MVEKVEIKPYSAVTLGAGEKVKRETEVDRFIKSLDLIITKINPAIALVDKRYSRLWAEPSQLFNAGKALRERAKNVFSANLDFAEDLIHILKTAENLELFLNMKKQAGIKAVIGRSLAVMPKEKRFAVEYKLAGFDGNFDRFSQFGTFLGHGDLMMKIHGLSMLDALTKHDLSLRDYYRWTVETNRIKNDSAYGQIYSENKNNPMVNDYPDMARERVELAVHQIVALAGMDSENFNLAVRKLLSNDSKNPSELRIVEKAKEIVKQANLMQENIFNSFFSPGSPDFMSLKEAFRDYLGEQNLFIQTVAFLSLGLNNPRRLKIAYRTAQELASKKDEHSPFYEGMTIRIKEFVERIKDRAAIFTSNDIGKFIANEDDFKGKSMPTFEDIEKITGEIFQKSSMQKYSINLQNAPPTNIMTPTNIDIEFSVGHPTSKFGIIMHYQNEKGEKLDLDLYFDTKKRILDWNFTENPNDPIMQDMKNTIMLTTQSILSSLKKQVDLESRGKQKVKIRIVDRIPPQNGAKKTLTEVYTPREKFKKPKSQKPLGIIDSTLKHDVSLPPEKGIKICIDIPEDSEPIRPKNIPKEQWQKLIQKITRYNQNNRAGNLELLTKTEEKKRIFRLRVDKKLRVLVIENPKKVDGSNGTKHYTIHMVIKRNNGYREV